MPSLARRFVVLFCLAAAGCKPAMPPAGVARFYLENPTPQSIGPQPYTGTAPLLLNVDYSGTRKILEWEVQIWRKGQPLPKSSTDRVVMAGPRQTLRYTMKDATPKGKFDYSIDYELRHSRGGGGGTTSGGSTPITLPDRPAGWAVTILPAPSIEVGEGQKATIWGLILHPEKIDLPPSSPLEAWASKADAAMLIRVRMTD